MTDRKQQPGYKLTPLGWIPEEWEVTTVSRSFKIHNHLRKPINTEERKYIQGPFPYYGPTKIQDYLNDFNIEGEYVLIGEDGDHFLKYKDWPMTQLVRGQFNVNNHAHLIKGGEGSETIWFYWFFCHRDISPYLTRQGAGRYKLTKAALESLPVILPPLPEQRAISAILSTWDEAINKTQQQIEHLKVRNRGLMNELLRPKDGWTEYRIGDLIQDVRRPVEWDAESIYDLISVRRRSGGAFFRQSLKGSEILTKNLFSVETDDFIISKMQIVHGASSIVPEHLNGMKISGSYIAVKSKDSRKISMRFLNWLSKTPVFYRLTYISSYGVHIEKMTFDFEDFIRHKIHIPDVEEQEKSTLILENAVKEQKTYEAHLTLLHQQKKGLMQVLLTGDVRVKTKN